jgi:hypothetical protein
MRFISVPLLSPSHQCVSCFGETPHLAQDYCFGSLIDGFVCRTEICPFALHTLSLQLIDACSQPGTNLMPCVQVEVNAAVVYDAKEGKSSVKVIISFFFKSLILLSQVVMILISVILMSSNQMLKVQSGTELESLVSCWLQTTVPVMSRNKAFQSEPCRLEWREVQSTLAMGSS